MPTVNMLYHKLGDFLCIHVYVMCVCVV